MMSLLVMSNVLAVGTPDNLEKLQDVTVTWEVQKPRLLNLAPPDERHLRGHHGHELHVGIQR